MQGKVAGNVAPTANSAHLQVVIPHRSPELTRAALKYAAGLANAVHSVDPRYLTRRIRNLARESTVPVSAEIIYAARMRRLGHQVIGWSANKDF